MHSIITLLFTVQEGHFVLVSTILDDGRSWLNGGVDSGQKCMQSSQNQKKCPTRIWWKQKAICKYVY